MARVKSQYTWGFPDRLVKAFNDSGLTVTELSARTGRNRSTIYSYLYGESSPDVLALARLALELDVSADWLVFGKEIPR